MSVNPGFGGQKFIPRALDKLRAVRQPHRPIGRDIWLEVDGGVKTDNIAEIARAGADTFVAGSAIFGAKDYAAIDPCARDRVRCVKRSRSLMTVWRAASLPYDRSRRHAARHRARSRGCGPTRCSPTLPSRAPPKRDAQLHRQRHSRIGPALTLRRMPAIPKPTSRPPALALRGLTIRHLNGTQRRSTPSVTRGPRGFTLARRAPRLRDQQTGRALHASPCSRVGARWMVRSPWSRPMPWCAEEARSRCRCSRVHTCPVSPPANAVLMIGDSANDALAARAAGCPVLLVPYGYNEGGTVQDLDCDGIVGTLLDAAQPVPAIWS